LFKAVESLEDDLERKRGTKERGINIWGNIYYFLRAKGTAMIQ